MTQKQEKPLCDYIFLYIKPVTSGFQAKRVTSNITWKDISGDWCDMSLYCVVVFEPSIDLQLNVGIFVTIK